MLPCRESARLIAVSYERPLGLWENLKLKWHLRACAICQRYREQMELVNRALSRVSDLIVTDEDRLSDDARRRIAGKMKLEGE